MKVKMNNKDSNANIVVDTGFCYLFYPCFLLSMLILPIVLFAIFRKQIFVISFHVVIFFMVFPFLLYLLQFMGSVGTNIALVGSPIFLLYIFYIVPKFLNRWKINGLIKRGFILSECQSEEVISSFEKEMANESHSANLF
ncbi:MAG: hypothetical protein ACRC5R_04570 [Mycoplasmatales bacterium]